jgi:hypothetical protein
MLNLLAVFLLFAADPFYIGKWKVDSAVTAPWSKPEWPPNLPEKKMLVGTTVIFSAREIQGTRQFACKAPHYRVTDYPADMLFQGMFGEMRDKDHSVDPDKVAATLGFRGKSWKTLETGCGNELDFHFVDDNTAEFGLNNLIYTLKKQ